MPIKDICAPSTIVMRIMVEAPASGARLTAIDSDHAYGARGNDAVPMSAAALRENSEVSCSPHGVSHLGKVDKLCSFASAEAVFETNFNPFSVTVLALGDKAICAMGDPAGTNTQGGVECQVLDQVDAPEINAGAE